MEIQVTLSQVPTTAGGKRFIESITFPWREVSKVSAVEKGPRRPPHWEYGFLVDGTVKLVLPPLLLS
jgi:hypothetical protein